MGYPRSSSDAVLMSPTSPSYKSEEEHEEDVGLLRATSNRLQFIAGRRFHGSRTGSQWYKLLVLLFLILGSFFLGALTSAGIIIYNARGSRDGGSQSRGADMGNKRVLHLAGELNGLVPEFKVRPVVFGKDPLATSDHKTEASTNATEENWRGYMPAGNGFIAVGKASKYTLPQPIEFHDQDIYSISVFHQLHCLHTIMQSYNSLSEPSPPSTHNHNNNHPPPVQGHTRRDSHNYPPHQPGPKPEHQHGHKHIDHCFRYLRQAIVCCGDTALEGQDLNHPDLKATDGTGAVHLCKDYGAVKEWAEGRRVTDKEGVI